MSALRITDADFVGNDGHGLAQLAYDIASTYQGNWSDMVAMKRHVLNLADDEECDWLTARAILNMAMGSPLLREKWERAIRYRLRTRQEHFPTPRRQPKLKVVRDEEIRRQVVVRTRVRIKTRWGHSVVKNAVLHIVGPEMSMQWYARELDWFGGPREYDYSDRKPQLHVRWMCGRRTDSKRAGFGRGLVLTHEPIEGMKHCRLCIEKEAEQQERYNVG